MLRVDVILPSTTSSNDATYAKVECVILCAKCRLPIEDSGIITSDGAFHVECTEPQDDDGGERC